MLDSVLKNFYERLGLSTLIRKGDYYKLAEFVSISELNNQEILGKLNAIYDTAQRAQPQQ